LASYGRISFRFFGLTILLFFFTSQNFNPDVKERASIYVPAIGKVTIVMLLRNLVRLVQNRPRQQNNGVEAA
jgi:methylenetetrahydrofolate dehydrogenase (NAD+)